MAVTSGVRAILKDIKVTKKGIVLSFEDVKLQGEELTDLASLIGGVVLLDVDSPQMDLFEDEDIAEAVEAVEDTDSTEAVETMEAPPEDLSDVHFEEPVTFSDELVAEQLGI